MLHEKHAPTNAERSTAELHESDVIIQLEYHDTPTTSNAFFLDKVGTTRRAGDLLTDSVLAREKQRQDSQPPTTLERTLF